MGLDARISDFLHAFSAWPALGAGADALNRMGKGDALAFACILLILAGYVAGRARWARIGGAAIAALSLSGLAVQSLKQLAGRARPMMNLGDSHFIGPHFFRGGYDSFPSGHAMSGFAVAAFLSAFFPRLKILFYSVAGLISVLGRVVMKHHFLSDVIAGAVLGAVLGLWAAGKARPWIERAGPARAVPPAPWDGEAAPWDWRHALLIAAFAGAILFTGIGRSALWDRDETEYAQSVVEMQQKGEWLIPTLEGQPFIEKPIFLFWMVRISYLLFGTSEFSSRFPGALFGVLTALAAYALGGALYGRRAGLFAGLILPACLLFVGGFRLLLTDSFFVFFATLSLLFYVYHARSGRIRHLLFAYAAIGFSFLCKGPIGLFPVSVFLAFEAWRGRVRPLRHAASLLCAAAIAGPWFAYSTRAESQAVSTFFLYENVSRFLRGAEGHSGPMFYFVIVLFAGLFPWSFFLFRSVSEEWRRRMSAGAGFHPGDFLILTWISALFVFFSLCATKLPHYMLPALPAFAAWLGKFWDGQIAEGRSLRPWLAATLALGLALTLAPVALYWARPQYASLRLVFPFALFSASAFAAWWRGGRPDRAFPCLCLGSLLQFTSFSAFSLPWIDRHRVLKPIALALKEQAPPGSNVYGYFLSEPSLFFYSGRLFPLVEHGTLDDLLRRPDDVFVVAKETRLREVSPSTPYSVLERRAGFAENGGEMAVVLLRNGPASRRP